MSRTADRLATKTQQRRAQTIELVGPAGAGKTTITNSLLQKERRMRVAPDISLRKPEHLGVSTLSIPSLLPVLRPRRGSAGRLTWEEMKSVIYLKSWPRVLSTQAVNNPEIILLDQGPVFRLATLHAFGPDSMRKPAMSIWWNEMLMQWASLLDVVIWLDAPNTILQQRINDRDRWHMVKGKSEQHVSQFLDRYRSSYDHVLRELSAIGGPRIAAFDTGKISTHELVNTILDSCTLKLDQN